jgi:hypothetical protein
MKLTLNELKYVINESKVQLLMELSNGAIEGMIRRAYPMYAEYFDCTLYELWNEYKDIAQSIGVENDDVQNYSSQQLKDYFRLKIRKDFKVNRINKRPEKIMKGIIRICLSDGINLFQDIAYYHQRLENYKNFIAIINYICSKGIYEQYDEDLGGLTFNELYKLYMPMIRGDAFIDWCKKTKATENKVFEGNDYVVKPIYSYEDAAKYKNYTSWCVTQNNGAYNSYTRDGGQFFFCLKNGFEDILRPDQPEGAPIDEYGLSMVSVLIMPNGDIDRITTRWNHTYNGENNPALRTYEDIEEKLNIPRNVFKSSVKPNIEKEDIQYILDNSDISLEDVFYRVHHYDAFDIGGLDDRGHICSWFIIRDRKLSDKEYASFSFIDDMAILIRYESNRNGLISDIISTTNGSEILTDIKGEAKPFVVGGRTEVRYFCVRKEYNVVNIIDINGEPLLPFDIDAIENRNGYAALYKDGKKNFINKDYKLILDEWITGLETTKNGVDMLCFQSQEDHLYRYMELPTGRIISFKGMKAQNIFIKDRNDKHLINDTKCNVVDDDDRILFDGWFDDISPLSSLGQDKRYYKCKIYGYDVLIGSSNGELINAPNDGFFEDIVFFDGTYGINDHNGTSIVFDINNNILFKLPDVMLFRRFTNGTYWGRYNNYGKLSFNIFDSNGEQLLPDGVRIVDIDIDSNQIVMEDVENVYFVHFNTGEMRVAQITSDEDID